MNGADEGSFRFRRRHNEKDGHVHRSFVYAYSDGETCGLEKRRVENIKGMFFYIPVKETGN